MEMSYNDFWNMLKSVKKFNQKIVNEDIIKLWLDDTMYIIHSNNGKEKMKLIASQNFMDKQTRGRINNIKFMDFINKPNK
jgi:hypothetical protein